MTIADSHHPQVFDTGEIIVYNKRVLVRFLLTWDESLSSFNGIIQHWTFSILIVELGHLDLWLVLANMRGITVLCSCHWMMRGKSCALFVHTVGSARNWRIPLMSCRYFIDSLVQFIVQHGLWSLMMLFCGPLIRLLWMLIIVRIIALKVGTNIFLQMLLFDQFLFIYELAGELNVVLFEVQWFLGFVDNIWIISNIFVFLDLNTVILDLLLLNILLLINLILILPNLPILISRLLHLVWFF